MKQVFSKKLLFLFIAFLFNGALAEICKVDNCNVYQKVSYLQSAQKCDCVITQADIPFVITDSGTYCLGESVDVAATDTGITIAAHCVTLCLNGHAINGNNVASTGVAVNGGLENVTVGGGLIKNMTFAGIASDGNDSATTNLVIGEMTFSNISGGFAIDFNNNSGVVDLSSFLVHDSRFINTNGIHVIAQQGVVQDVIMEDTVADATSHSIILTGLAGAPSVNLKVANATLTNGGGTIRFEDARFVQAENCTVEVATDEGFIFTNVENIITKNCTAKNCPINGFRIANDTQELTSALLDTCVTLSCGRVGMMLEVDGAVASNVKFIDCCCMHNGTDRTAGFPNGGFLVITRDNYGLIENLVFENCVSQDDFGNGFSVQAGGGAESINTILFKNCVAQDTKLQTVYPYAEGSAFNIGGDYYLGNGSYNNITFVDCAVKNSFGDGFTIRDGNELLMINCTHQGGQRGGIDVNLINDVCLQDCTIQDLSVGSSRAIDVVIADNLLLKNCKVQNVNGGIFARATRVSLEDCSVFGVDVAGVSPSEGIEVFGQPCEYAQLKNCAVANCSGIGIDINCSGMFGCDLINCIVEQCGEYGIKVGHDNIDTFVNNTKLVGCVAKSCTLAGISFSSNRFMDRDNIIVRDCCSELNGGNGIEFVLGSGNSVDVNNIVLENCILQKNTGSGFVTSIEPGASARNSNINNVLIKDCVAQENGSGGYSITIRNNLSIINSTAMNNGADGFNINNGPTLLNQLGRDLVNVELINCTAQGSTGHGFIINQNKGATVRDILFKSCSSQGNGITGFQLFHFDTFFGDVEFRNIIFDECLSQRNLADGFSIVFNTSNAEFNNSIFRNCIAQANQAGTIGGYTYNGDGFGIGTVIQANGIFRDIIFENCISQANAGDGYGIMDLTEGSIIGCIGENNTGDGFNMDSTTASIKLIDNCAVGNTVNGFIDGNAAVTTNHYLGNSSSDNGTDYAGTGIDGTLVATGAAAIAAAANRWINISI